MKIYEIRATVAIKGGTYAYEEDDNGTMRDDFRYGFYATQELAEKALAIIGINSLAKKSQMLNEVRIDIANDFTEKFYFYKITKNAIVESGLKRFDITVDSEKSYKTISIYPKHENALYPFGSCHIFCDIAEHEVEEEKNMVMHRYLIKWRAVAPWDNLKIIDLDILNRAVGCTDGKNYKYDPYVNGVRSLYEQYTFAAEGQSVDDHGTILFNGSWWCVIEAENIAQAAIEFANSIIEVNKEVEE